MFKDIDTRIREIEALINGKVIIAPLAGYTNLAYRSIMKDFGASLVYTEMVSAKGLIFDNKQTYDYILTNDHEKPVAIQLFGGDIDDLVKATKIVCEKSTPSLIDINMGCPIKKVLKQDAGSALLENPDKIYEMVRRVVEVSTVPVSVKIRAGVDHSHINCVEVAKKIEEAGASLIAIHGRTKSDLYHGTVNLDYIKMVKDAVRIPVIGNGDIKTIEDAQKMLDYTGCDYVMIGRSTLGNPWFIRNLVNYFDNSSERFFPTTKERLDMVRYHYKELKKIKCEKIAILEMRSMASWYMKSINNIKSYRIKLNNVSTEKEFLDMIDEIESLN